MTKKNLTLVVTDHQLTADTIAQALGATNKCNGYYHGNGYAVTWTGGQLIEATYAPLQSFVLSTTLNPDLVFAHNFKFAMRNYDTLVGYKKTAKDAEQLAVIKALWKMSGIVVNAMSPDVDGEVNFLSLYYYLAMPIEVRRAWLPILTNPKIVKGIERGPAYPERYTDWKETAIYNFLVDKCEEEIAYKEQNRFIEVPSEIAVDYVPGMKECGITEAHNGDVSVICGYRSGIYTVSDKPTLFNLPHLLVAAACDLNFTHEKTIQTALNLYGKKLISYPIVEQNYIPSEVWHDMLRNREKLRFNTKWGKRVKGYKVSKRHNFDDCMNPYYGHGIVTTGLHPTNLTRDEEKLYNLIVKQVIDAFIPARTLKAMARNAKRRKGK